MGGRCDSFVVETNVHHPTDFSLLLDSVRCLIRKTTRVCGEVGVPGWRQWRHRRRKVKRLYRRVSAGKKWTSNSDDVRAYLAASRKIADKAQASLATLRADGDGPGPALDGIDRLLCHARLFADQIERCVLQGETIPYGEKVFSTFEEHTRRISKGKAGKTVEPGVSLRDQIVFKIVADSLY